MSSVTMEFAVTAAIVGVVVGWLLTVIIKGWGFGLIGNMIVGIVGAVVAAFCFRAAGLYSFPFSDSIGNLIPPLTQAAFGALVLVLVVGITRKRTA